MEASPANAAARRAPAGEPPALFRLCVRGSNFARPVFDRVVDLNKISMAQGGMINSAPLTRNVDPRACFQAVLDQLSTI